MSNLISTSIRSAMFAGAASVILIAGMGSTGARTLKETIGYALKKHPAIKASYARRDSAKSRVRVERGALFPEIGIRGATGYEYTNSPGTRGRASRPRRFGKPYASLHRSEAIATLRQLIYDGGQTWNLVKRAKALGWAADHRVVNTRQNIALQAVAAHIDVCRHRTFVRYATVNLHGHGRLLRSIRQLTGQGRQTRADLAQARSRYSRALAILRQRQGALREAIVRYEQTVGTKVPPEKLDVPMRPPAGRKMSLSQALTVAQKQNPELRARRAETKSREYAHKATRGLYMPRVSVEADAGVGNNISGVRGEETEFRAMLVLTWNLYRGGSDRARRQEALANLVVARYDEADVRRIVRERVRQAYEAFVANRSRIGPLTTRVATNLTVVLAYAEQFKVGRRSLLDRLDVQNELFVSRIERADARYTMMFNYYALVAATGQLLRYFAYPADPAKSRRTRWQGAKKRK